MPEKKRQKGYSVDCHDVVHLVEFCPYDWCSQLIAIGTATRVTVGTCRFPEDSPELDDLEWSTIKEIHHGSRITALAWSPETSLVAMPKLVRFCTAAADKQLRLYSSDPSMENQFKVIGSHKEYINSICFLKLAEPHQAWLVASASDDHTCRIWKLDGTEVGILPLGAPGMAVDWHHQEPGKLMVAEKNGVIRFYNAETLRPIMSLDCGYTPLVSADWCPGNPLRVAAAAGTDWFVFDTSRSSRPLENKQAHPEGCRAIGWCRSHDHILATTGCPAVQLKVFSIRTGHASLGTQMSISYGLSWHHQLPLVAVGGDKKVHFWAVEPL